MKVALAQVNPIIGDLGYNRAKIIHSIHEAKKRGAELIVFPEMVLPGYPPEDLLLLPSFIAALSKELEFIRSETRGIAAFVGTVRENPSGMEKGLFNTAAIFDDGRLIGFQDKRLLPEYDVFSEKRYFEPGRESLVWEIKGKDAPSPSAKISGSMAVRLPPTASIPSILFWTIRIKRWTFSSTSPPLPFIWAVK